MRSRLVIPAALLLAAVYVKSRQDAFLFAPGPPPPDPTPEAIRRAEAEAADAWEIGLAGAEAVATIALPEPPVLSEWSTVPATPLRAPAASPAADPAPLNEWLSHLAHRPAEPVAPAAAAGPETPSDESGRFSLGGWAVQPGHMALCGITFRRRREGPVDPSRIRLVMEAAQNLAGEGLVVLSDAGFAPDREGFTILLAAGGSGPFAVSGRYVVLP